MKEKIKIGNSDYTREEMQKGDSVWAIGCSSDYFLKIIKQYEDAGYEVKFETNFFRRIFGIATYKVIAYK
jgi:hypothetical protein